MHDRRGTAGQKAFVTRPSSAADAAPSACGSTRTVNPKGPVRRNFTERREIGAALAVYRDGGKVVDLWGGERDGKRGLPWEPDTLVATRFRYTFLDDPRGTIQVGDREVRVRAVRVRGERIRDAVERAYEEKYATPASRKFVRGFRTKRRRDTTVEFLLR